MQGAGHSSIRDVYPSLGTDLQRDLNCLADSDRTSRRRALTRLEKLLLGKDPCPEETVMRRFLVDTLSLQLITLLADPVEKCRELSAGLLLSCVKAITDVTEDTKSLALRIAPAVAARIGETPFVEVAEEVRLLELQLLEELLGRDSAKDWCSEIAQDMAKSVSHGLADSFAEVKRKCCSIVIQAATIDPAVARLHQEQLMRPLTANLGHQHSKTRQMTLQAIGALITCGADSLDKMIKELLLPQFSHLVYDRTPAVRKVLAQVLSDALCHSTLPQGTYLVSHRPQLLPLLMMLMDDDSEEVSKLSASLLENFGNQWCLGRSEGGERPRPEAGASGIRLCCAALLPKVLPPVLEGAYHWTVRHRHRALLLLKQLVCFAGADIAMHVKEVVTCLLGAVTDDEKEVAAAAASCGQALGQQLQDPTLATDLLLPLLQGKVSGQATTQHFTQAALLLEAVMSDPEGKALGKLSVSDVCQALGSRAMLVADLDAPLMDALLGACQLILGSSAAAESIVKDPLSCVCLLRTLLLLLADEGGEEEEGEAGSAQCLRQLAAVHGLNGSQELFARYYLPLLESILHPEVQVSAAALSCVDRPPQPPGIGTAAASERPPTGASEWTKASKQRHTFDLLIRAAPLAASQNLAMVVHIFRDTLCDSDKDPELRLHMMVLLEGLLSRAEVTQALVAPHSDVIVMHILVPNAVWRAGAACATLRKATIACLYTLMAKGKLTKETLFRTAAQMLPVLKTNLEDYDATTRQLVCSIMRDVFFMLPSALGEDPVRDLYPELLKRLDDSSDEVRKAVCGTLCAFFEATPAQVVRGTVLDYSVEQLLVHLDDQEEAMQAAVLRVLQVAQKLDPAMVQRKAQAARSAQRSPAWIDKLLSN
ncbi:unnamed protein product [Chrysoparadoxa australica]